MTTLYASHYSGPTEIYITIKLGIYETRSTNSDKVYPSVKSLGTINITERKFYKHVKRPEKVVEQEEGRIRLNGYQREYKEIGALFLELGYSTELLNEITEVVLTNAFDPTVKVSGSVDY
jgi:hypothetical protein